MRHVFFLKTIVVFTSIFLFSCEKQITPLVILISPQESITSEVGDTLVAEVQFICDEVITSLQVHQRNYKNETTLVCDTIPLNNKLIFVYKVPNVQDSTYVTLDFHAKSNSYSQTISKTIFVRNNEKLLTEYSGFSISSKLSGSPFGFDLQNLKPVFAVADSLKSLDFFDYSIDSINYNSLSRKWVSFSGIDFARFNDFEYVKATQKSVTEAYKYASKKTVISNLDNDDILLIGKNNKAIGIIRLTQIVDTDSTLYDRYYFNLKLIE